MTTCFSKQPAFLQHIVRKASMPHVILVTTLGLMSSWGCSSVNEDTSQVGSRAEALSSSPSKKHDPYRLVTTMKVPNVPPGSFTFDLVWYDHQNHSVYVSDATNLQVDIFDADTLKYVGAIKGNFTGYHGGPAGPYDTFGPAGLLTDNHNHLYVGNGDSTVKIANLQTGAIVASINTGGKKRADEMSYDPEDGLVFVTNPDEMLPFGTFISVKEMSVVGQISFPDAVDSSGKSLGLEQSVWDPKTEKFYLAMPATRTNPGGEIDVIDPHCVISHPHSNNPLCIKVFPLTTCNPSGLALGPHHDLLAGCQGPTQIVQVRTGHVDAVISEISGSDQVWYNPGDHRYYLGASGDPSGPVLGVIDAENEKFVTAIPTTLDAHSVAADSVHNRVFVPVGSEGVRVYEY